MLICPVNLMLIDRLPQEMNLICYISCIELIQSRSISYMFMTCLTSYFDIINSEILTSIDGK
jgi:hypothetical protein